jgi:hypothetical protein
MKLAIIAALIASSSAFTVKVEVPAVSSKRCYLREGGGGECYVTA